MKTNGDNESAWTVLGDGSRREILELLTRDRMAVGELADRLPISRPAVSQHLKVLKDAGVVTDEQHGTRRVYSVNAVALSALRDQLDAFWSRALSGFTDAAQRSTPTEQDESHE
ncbi:ArsR/SmtB family transcription factor [Gordonia hydrophobica]|uniref:Metalloregulator ArsR/SmtB family transcription factor n=1 Tax=Gordonia hydrophobica TaxID=40516 RepID=A0ABZ2U1G2_9ACTN|nr:metalloregulator ArsR/SmtB family transcription factor [Gordonia hydrophobica]MBM7366604.1 DNA-binding transcriptional ArsR family regulator [Gordonia hydrophobica]